MGIVNAIAKILTLPPVQQRSMLTASSVWFRINLTEHYQKEKDDFYIYYLLWKSTIYSSLVVMFCSLLYMGMLNIGAAKPEEWLRFFNYVLFYFSFFILYPIFFLIFFRNIKLKKFDILWTISEPAKSSKNILLCYCSIVLLTFLPVIYWAYGGFLVLANRFDKDMSLIFALCSGILICWIYSFAIPVIFRTLIISWFCLMHMVTKER